MTEEVLAGGNVAPVVRVGNTVRRVTGPWTPAVHALLRHLEAVGFDGAPRVLGVDDQGREVLTFVEGEPGIEPLPVTATSDEGLVAMARLIRRYHDAVERFAPPPDASWRLAVGAPTTGDLVCHNDLAPYNTIYRRGAPVALIDWDLAAPAPREWDIAYALWRFVPLYDDAECRSRGLTPEPRGRRIRLFCDAYGLENRAGLLDVVRRRQQAVPDSVQAWAAEGHEGFARMWAEGMQGPLDDIAYLDEQRDAWERYLTT